MVFGMALLAGALVFSEKHTLKEAMVIAVGVPSRGFCSWEMGPHGATLGPHWGLLGLHRAAK